MYDRIFTNRLSKIIISFSLKVLHKNFFSHKDVQILLYPYDVSIIRDIAINTITVLLFLLFHNVCPFRNV